MKKPIQKNKTHYEHLQAGEIKAMCHQIERYAQRLHVGRSNLDVLRELRANTKLKTFRTRFGPRQYRKIYKAAYRALLNAHRENFKQYALVMRGGF